MTENHDLHTPEKGAKNWHNPLNTNFNLLDNKVEIRDRSANRSNYAPTAGAKFLATDTGKIYFGDGNNWNELPSSGHSPSFNSVSTDRINHVRIANENQTIQEAHDALPSFADGGQIVVTPSYDAGDSLPINITKPVVISGQGWGQNQGVVFSGNSKDKIFHLDLANNFGRAAMCFQNLRIEGGDIGVEIADANRAEFRNCLFYNQNTSHVTFLDNSAFSGWIYFDHCLLTGAGDIGVDMRVSKDINSPNASMFFATTIGNAGAQGLLIDGQGTNYYAGSVEGCAMEGIFASEATANTTINGTYFEGNGDGNGGNHDADIRIADAYGTQVKNTFHSGSSPAGTAIVEERGYNSYIDGVRGANASVQLGSLENSWDNPSEPTIGWITPQGSISVDQNVLDNRHPRIHGLGIARGDREEPIASDWQTGEMVEWTDTGDGSGDGIYILKSDGTWSKIS